MTNTFNNWTMSFTPRSAKAATRLNYLLNSQHVTSSATITTPLT